MKAEPYKYVGLGVFIVGVGVVIGVLLRLGMPALAEEPERPAYSLKNEFGGEIGRLEPDVTDDDRYVIKNEFGRELGSIRPEAAERGDYVIRDRFGKKVGIIEKEEFQ